MMMPVNEPSISESNGLSYTQIVSFKKYFHQLLFGCPNKLCQSKHCKNHQKRYNLAPLTFDEVLYLSLHKAVCKEDDAPDVPCTSMIVATSTHWTPQPDLTDDNLLLSRTRLIYTVKIKQKLLRDTIYSLYGRITDSFGAYVDIMRNLLTYNYTTPPYLLNYNTMEQRTKSRSIDGLLLDDVVRVFGDPVQLATNFMKHPVKIRSPSEATDSQLGDECGLNFIMIKETMMYLCSLRETNETRVYYDTFLTSVDGLLNQLDNTNSYSSATIVRSVMIVLEFPMINEMELKDRVINRLVDILSTLDAKSFLLAKKWMAAAYNFRKFENLAALFSKSLEGTLPSYNIRSFPASRSTELIKNSNANTLFSTLKVLLLLNAGYDQACYYAGVNYAPIDIFYNDYISGNINLKLEYLVWASHITTYKEHQAVYTYNTGFTKRDIDSIIAYHAKTVNKRSSQQYNTNNNANYDASSTTYTPFIATKDSETEADSELDDQEAQNLIADTASTPTTAVASSERLSMKRRIARKLVNRALRTWAHFQQPARLESSNLNEDDISLDTVYNIYRHPNNECNVLQFPFVLNQLAKFRLFQMDSVNEMCRNFESSYIYDAKLFYAKKGHTMGQHIKPDMKRLIDRCTHPFLKLDVRRDHIIDDTFSQLSFRSQFELRKPLRIKFIHGGEDGYDMGGVQKEYFQLITSHFFSLGVGMFTFKEDTRNYWINPGSLEPLTSYELFGTILGLAALNGVLLNLHLPFVFYKKLLCGTADNVNDLKDVDGYLHRSLLEIIQWSESLQGPLEDVLCYTFQILSSTGDVYIDLIPTGASETKVTANNKLDFVKLYANHILNQSIDQQFKSIKRGFFRIANRSLVAMYRPEELESIICGTTYLNFTELRHNTAYENGYNMHSRVIIWFWEIVLQFSNEQKRMLLFFVTGTDRIPIQGMAAVSFTIQRNGDDPFRLPTALTCFSRLLLPDYPSQDILSQKLTLAIYNNRGFGLI